MRTIMIKKVIVIIIMMGLLVGQLYGQSLNHPWKVIESDPFYDPVLVREYLGGEWTVPILVYSNPKIDVYIGESSIERILFWSTDYIKMGNFSVQLFWKLKDETSARTIVDAIQQKEVNVVPWDTRTKLDPESVKYYTCMVLFDMGNRKVIVSRELILDKEGIIIAGTPDQPTGDGYHRFFPEYKKEMDSFFSQVAKGIINILERVKSYPKNADRLKEIQRSQQTK